MLDRPTTREATATHASRCCSGVDPIREDDSDHMYGQQVVKGNAIGGKEKKLHQTHARSGILCQAKSINPLFALITAARRSTPQ